VGAFNSSTTMGWHESYSSISPSLSVWVSCGFSESGSSEFLQWPCVSVS
jgi:hypothetical protein